MSCFPLILQYYPVTYISVPLEIHRCYFFVMIKFIYNATRANSTNMYTFHFLLYFCTTEFHLSHRLFPSSLPLSLSFLLHISSPFLLNPLPFPIDLSGSPTRRIQCTAKSSHSLSSHSNSLTIYINPILSPVNPSPTFLHSLTHVHSMTLLSSSPPSLPKPLCFINSPSLTYYPLSLKFISIVSCLPFITISVLFTFMNLLTDFFRGSATHDQQFMLLIQPKLPCIYIWLLSSCVNIFFSLRLSIQQDGTPPKAISVNTFGFCFPSLNHCTAGL